MNSDTVTQLAIHAMTITLEVSAPFLIAGLVVGLLVSIFQAATSIQEVTLSFIPKILVTGGVVSSPARGCSASSSATPSSSS